eukprot:scaffold3947_cov179-Amphora_coffeaeformis.AAC.4
MVFGRQCIGPHLGYIQHIIDRLPRFGIPRRRKAGGIFDKGFGWTLLLLPILLAIIIVVTKIRGWLRLIRITNFFQNGGIHIVGDIIGQFDALATHLLFDMLEMDDAGDTFGRNAKALRHGPHSVFVGCHSRGTFTAPGTGIHGEHDIGIQLINLLLIPLRQPTECHHGFGKVLKFHTSAGRGTGGKIIGTEDFSSRGKFGSVQRIGACGGIPFPGSNASLGKGLCRTGDSRRRRCGSFGTFGRRSAAAGTILGG